MSHVSTYKMKITDKTLFVHACAKKGYEVKIGNRIVQQFSSNRVPAIAEIKIPGWRYNIALTEEGDLKYDHFGSQPNTMELLGELVQDYNEAGVLQNVPFEKVQNHWTEQMENGDRKLVLEFE